MVEIRDEEVFHRQVAKSAKERFGLPGLLEDGENEEGDAGSFFAWRSWRLGGSNSPHLWQRRGGFRREAAQDGEADASGDEHAIGSGRFAQDRRV